MLTEDLEPRHIELVETLIRKITPDQAAAAEVIGEFRKGLDQDLEDEEEGFVVSLLHNVREASDDIYYVDWKDTASFVHFASQLAENWGHALTFGVADPTDEGFLRSHSIPDLIRIADRELGANGLGLWDWDTDGDCYSGWVAKRSDGPFFAQVSAALGVRITQGSDLDSDVPSPFDDGSAQGTSIPGKPWWKFW